MDELFTFTITDNTGTVLDFGCYPIRECAISTACESYHFNAGNVVTIADHDADGNAELIARRITVDSTPDTMANELSHWKAV